MNSVENKLTKKFKISGWVTGCINATRFFISPTSRQTEIVGDIKSLLFKKAFRLESLVMDQKVSRIELTAGSEKWFWQKNENSLFENEMLEVLDLGLVTPFDAVDLFFLKDYELKTKYMNSAYILRHEKKVLIPGDYGEVEFHDCEDGAVKLQYRSLKRHNSKKNKQINLELLYSHGTHELEQITYRLGPIYFKITAQYKI